MKTSPAMEQTTSQDKAVACGASCEISKVSVATISIGAALIGCWATACLFAGIINSGGPVALAKNLINAMLG